MQTFLPYESYAESTRVLDPRRLGNQVYREVISLIRGGWSHHPASKMWTGHFHHLALYGLAGIEELKRRGLFYPKTERELRDALKSFPDTGPPSWLGREDFHASHRSNLLRKDYTWYSRYGWKEPLDLPYVWPSIVSPPQPRAASALTKGRSNA